LVDGGTTAVIEMSAASGLPLLTPEERNPWLTTTYGTGEMIADAIQRGARRLLIGIGGSATNDAGMGMLEALGYRFYDADGAQLAGCGGNLSRVASIGKEEALPALKECQITVACDVKNPLYGPTGAAYVFAPQKGADAEMVELLDLGLRNFASVASAYSESEAELREGAGAAGGLGYCFCALLGARLQSGIDMVLEAIDFAKRIESSDLIITGEGRIDSQTVMGKAPSGVLSAARRQGIPCIAIGGGVRWCEELRGSDFAAILPIVSAPMALEEAMRCDVAAQNVERTAQQVGRMLKIKLN
jgi:glycerate kinase